MFILRGCLGWGKPFACIASEAMPKNALCQMFSKLLCVFHVAKLHAFYCEI